MRPRRGIKFEITELILELRFIYETAPDGFSYLSPPCTTPTAAPYAAGATWPPMRRTPAQTALERPRFAPWPSPLAARARGTRPRPPGRPPRPPAPCDGRRRSLATRPRHPGRPPPARSLQFALLPLPAPIKGVGLPLHARTARPRHSLLRRAQALRGAASTAPHCLPRPRNRAPR